MGESTLKRSTIAKQYALELLSNRISHLYGEKIVRIVYGDCFRKGGVMMGQAGGYGGGFALIVVLFILLIIVGAAWL